MHFEKLRSKCLNNRFMSPSLFQTQYIIFTRAQDVNGEKSCSLIIFYILFHFIYQIDRFGYTLCPSERTN